MGHEVKPHLNLLAEMKRRRITKVEMARRMQITTATLNGKTSGRYRFSYAEKLLVCQILGMDYEQFGKQLFDEEAI